MDNSRSLGLHGLRLLGLALTYILLQNQPSCAASSSAGITITLANSTPLEQAAEAQLKRLLNQYDLEPLIFTRQVRIETGVRPQSHPVLTLNTRHLNDDERQLATFIHEQLHWFVGRDQRALEDTLAALRHRYPQVPVGRREGARNAYSTRLHLIIGLLELDALTLHLGRERARVLIGQIEFYRWIYATVLSDEESIREITSSHGLALPKE